MINLDANDIRIGKKNKEDFTLKPQTNKFDSKKLVENRRSNHFFEREKKDSHYFTGVKKFNDLRMYLKPSSNKKKEYYSEVKRRQ